MAARAINVKIEFYALSKKIFILMKFDMPMLLVIGSIYIVLGVRGTPNVEARGGPKIGKNRKSPKVLTILH